MKERFLNRIGVYCISRYLYCISWYPCCIWEYNKNILNYQRKLRFRHYL